LSLLQSNSHFIVEEAGGEVDEHFFSRGRR